MVTVKDFWLETSLASGIDFSYSIGIRKNVRVWTLKLINESSKTKIVNNLMVAILAVYGISQKRFDLNETTMFHQLVTEVISPIQEGLSDSKKSLSFLWENYLLIVNTSKENNILKKQISRLESDLTTMEEVRKAVKLL